MAATIALCLLPASALADNVASVTKASGGEPTYYSSLQKALDAAQPADTITLLADVGTGNTLYITKKDVTFDLNGYDLTFWNAGSLHCRNSATITNTNANDRSKIKGSTTLQLCIESQEGQDTNVTLEGNLTIEGTSPYEEGKERHAVRIRLFENGGSIKLTVNDDVTLISKTHGICYQDTNHSEGRGVTIEINGGAIKSGYDPIVYAPEYTSANYTDKDAKITISGGLFSKDVSKYSEYKIAEGYFCIDNADPQTSTDLPYMVTNGTASVTSSDGTTTKYLYLSDAVTAAKSGDTVTLLYDAANFSDHITLDKDLTLDLNGHSIWLGSKYLISTAGVQTIKNSGTDGAKIVSQHGAGTLWVCPDTNTSAAVTLEGGVTVESTSTGTNSRAAYLRGGSGKTATLNVNGATLRGGKSGIETLRGGCTVNVISGAVYGTDKAINQLDGAINVSGGIFSSDVSDYVAEGYACVANDDAATSRDYPYKVGEAQPRFAGHSLLLTGQVGLQFLVELPKGKTPADYEGAYVTLSGNKLDGTVQYPLSKADTMNVDGSTRYVFTANLSSIQLADKVTPTLHYGSGDAATVITGDAYSAQDYLDWALADGSGTLGEKQLAVVQALADYGFYAQKYCSVQNGWEIGTHYAEQKTVCTTNMSSSWDTVKGLAAEYALVASDASVVEKFGHRLVFGSTLSLEMRFKMADGSALEGVTVNDNEVATTKSGSYYVASVKDIFATQLTKKMAVKAGTAELEISPMSYVYAGLSKESSTEAFKNLLCALCYYGKAAKDLAQAS